MSTDTDHLNQGVALQDQNVSTNQFLTFMLGEEEYGVDILNVQEIRSWESATSIPNTPDYVLGVINLRGLVVPIIDLRKRFAMSSAEFGPATIIVIVKLLDDAKTSKTVGMVVDEVSDVYNISGEDVGEMPDLGSVVGTEFIKGVASVNEKMVIILNIESLINTGVLGEDNTDFPVVDKKSETGEDQAASAE
ncbi:MAG: purine-binding chemotaxis protein CheW [Gammaproteobacteria bacterium]|nr:purine-binding chemotaxis protein CheW [Gammaproteobacteria bacterium]